MTIVAFCCWNCAYAAADFAGVSREEYPSNVQVVRVPCTGEVRLTHVFHALLHGAQGVMVCGCQRDGCHYVDGNQRAEDLVGLAKRILEQAGLSGDRVEMYFMSSSDKDLFVEAAEEMSRRELRSLPPLPVKQEDHGERGVLRGQVRRLFEVGGRSPDGTIEAPGDLELFAFASIDEDECDGCTACAWVCKTTSIQYEDHGDERHICQVYWRCTACGMCERICPREAINLKREVSLTALLADEPRVLARTAVLRCVECGEPIAPRVQAREALELVDIEDAGLCSKCRREKEARKLGEILRLRGRGSQ